MSNSVKPKSQLDKRMDAMESGGSTYYAGPGLGLSDNTFSLAAAGQANLGGVRLNLSPDVPEDDTTNNRSLGIYRGVDVFPTLRTASKNQKGGFFLGDGFVPVLEEDVSYTGETVYTKTGYVQLRLGEGLEFVDNDEASTDPKEISENYNGGRRVSVKIDGTTLKLNDKGELTAEGYVEGAAIVFRVADEQTSINVNYDDETLKADGGPLRVNIDNETIKVNDDGELESIGVTIENGIIIQEADAKYLLHEYTEVEYIAGNRIIYAGPYNQVIVQGYIIYNNKGTAPNGVAMNRAAAVNLTIDQIPNAPAYLTYNFSIPANSSTYGDFTKLDAEMFEMGADYVKYNTVYTLTDGSKTITSNGMTNYDNYSDIAFVLRWNSIISPGTVVNDRTYEYGGVLCTGMRRFKNNANSNGYAWYSLDGGTISIPFASEAEYNAAVGLTYEPLTLQQVNETVTEV